MVPGCSEPRVYASDRRWPFPGGRSVIQSHGFNATIEMVFCWEHSKRWLFSTDRQRWRHGADELCAKWKPADPDAARNALRVFAERLGAECQEREKREAQRAAAEKRLLGPDKGSPGG
jgi:hypothetical protein